MDLNKDGLTSEEEYFHRQQAEQLAKLREVAAIESEEVALAAAKELHCYKWKVRRRHENRTLQGRRNRALPEMWSGSARPW